VLSFVLAGHDGEEVGAFLRAVRELAEGVGTTTHPVH
jgi:hypothetical protein